MKEYNPKKAVRKNITPIIILIIGIFIDIYVNFTGDFLIAVTESYMDYVYAGIISISILCFSFIALISGFLDRTFYGYKMREIFQFEESNVNFKYDIIYSLGAIVLATVFLAGNFVMNFSNSLTALLFGIIFFEGNIAFKIYQIITEDNICYDLVVEHFRNGDKKRIDDYRAFQSDVDKMISALKIFIDENDAVGKNNVCDMLSNLAENIQARAKKNNNYCWYDYFNQKVRDCIYEFTNTFGYNEMIKNVIKIYHYIPDFKYARIDLYCIPLNNMRFWNDKNLIEQDYFDQISQIDFIDEYKNGDITNLEVEKILYCYFQNVLSNLVCSEPVKKQIIETYIQQLAKFHWKTNEKGTEVDSIGLLNILVYFVLKNENTNERNLIFQILAKELFYNISLFSDEKSYDFLSLFFQAFYAYIFFEEVLNTEYREMLKETFTQEISSATLEKRKVSQLLGLNIRSILRAIGRRIERQNNDGRKFEYFPEFMMVKKIVWTPNFDIEYLFILYLIYNDEVGYYSIYESCFDWKNIQEDKQFLVLSVMLEKFDKSNGLLKSDFVNECILYGKLLGHTHTISESNQQKLFKHINKELTNILEKRTNNIKQEETNLSDDRINDILNEINELMKKDEIFGWDTKCSSDFCLEFSIHNYIVKKRNRTNREVARIFQNAIIDSLQKYIDKYTNELILTFDLDGINKLSEFLLKGKYNARNYTFTEDLALGKYKNTKEFNKLIELQNKLSLNKTPQMNSKLFFQKENFKFNAKISKLQSIDLNEQECADFIEISKAYNGLYNVEGALMSKEKAIKIIKNLYHREIFEFELMIAFKGDDVTHIVFKY